MSGGTMYVYCPTNHAPATRMLLLHTEQIDGSEVRAYVCPKCQSFWSYFPSTNVIRRYITDDAYNAAVEKRLITRESGNVIRE